MKQMNSFFRMSCLAVAALAITASCSNEELDGVNGLSKANTFITATFEQPDGGIKTRTTLGDGNKVLWQSGDQFKLFYGSSDAVFKTEGSGESVTFGANISGDISGATYAIFPIMTDVNVTLSGKTATTILRKEIPFSEATNGPMWADASTDYTNLSFKHLAGLLKLTVSGLSVSDGETLTLKIKADKKIAGAAKVDFSASGEPFLAVAESGDDVFDEITVTNVKPVAGQATVFYVPLPVKTLGELKVNIYNSKDTTTPLYKEKKWTNVAVARAMIRSASFGFEQITVSDNISQKIQEAVNGAAATEPVTTTVEISGELKTDENTTNKTISVPSEENKNVALVFAQAPTTSASNALTIQDAETGASQTDAVNTITVSLPATTAAVENVEINTPQSTVELTSNATEASEKTLYTTITATTANNTLVVGDKVEIGTILAKAGNIRLKKGSKVTTITRDASYSGTLYIYKETGADYAGASGENVEVVDGAQDANLETVLAKGGTYILPAELKLTKPLDVYGEVTFDLNGYKVTYADGFSGGALFLVHRGGKLIVNDSRGGGSIDSYDSNLISGILLTAKSDETNTAIQSKNAIVEINAGTIKGNDYAVVGQGTRHGTQITINGGTLESKVGAGIYHPQDGTLTINGGTITGADTGVELRSGKLIITGGTFTSTTDPATVAPNGSGTTTAGAALAVVQHTTKKDINVTISGGTFNGVYGLFQKDVENNNTENVTMSVTGGTFNGQIYSENCPAFITGGNFNDVSAVNYLADGGNINVTLAADASMGTFGLSANKTATIDLNGNTLNLTSKDNDSVIYGTAVFKNGTITVADDAKSTHTIYGLEGCDITLDKVTLNGGYYAMFVQGPQAKVEVKNNSTINAKYFTFSTNATGSDDGEPDWGFNATITLTDSEFIAEETGFMNNVPATVTIENCKFQGNHQAALLRGGKYTIKNSTFTLKADLPYDNGENKHFKKSGVSRWGEGNQCAFAGLTIGNYGGNSYQYATTVDMTGVTVKVEGTNAASFPAMHACANSAEGKGVTITYDSASQFTASGYDPAMEYGTTNITVNGKAVQQVEGSFVVPTE